MGRFESMAAEPERIGNLSLAASVMNQAGHARLATQQRSILPQNAGQEIDYLQSPEMTNGAQ